MTAFLASNFKIYQEYLRTRASEVLQQQANLFNAAVNNSIIMQTVEKPGDFEFENFFTSIAGLVTRRDNTVTTAATKLSLAQDEFVRVKLNRKIGPVDQSRDAFRKLFARFDEMEFSGILGQQIAVAQQLDMANTALLALRAALAGYTPGAGVFPLLSDASLASPPSMTTNDLVDGLAKFGDRADRIVAWVMHSKPYYDLVKNQITSNITNVSNFNIQTATPITLNRPVLVTDSDSLKVAVTASPAHTEYYTLGLTAQGALVEVTETSDIVTQDVTGNEVLMVRLQGEFAYNLGIKGMKYDTTQGINPNVTTLQTPGVWVKSATDIKSLAGVVIKTR